MSILLGQSPQTTYSTFVVFGVNRYGYNCISAVYQDTAATIDYINIKAARLGSSGDVTVSVYDTPYTDFSEISGLNDGDPVTIGNLIGSKTLDSSGWNTSVETHTFTFSSPINLPDYGIFIFAVSHPTGDSNNCVKWAFPSGSGYTQIKSTNGGSTWSKDTGITGIYQTYGTVLSVPEKPINPTPTNAATNITLDQATISWEDGGGATSYDVYYGQNEGGLTLVSEGQTETSFTITGVSYGSPFDYITSRTWRIDAVNAAGTTTGDVWTFTTIAFDPPLPTGVTLDGSGNPTGTPTGVNTMITVRRLVVAANSKIWYEDI